MPRPIRLVQLTKLQQQQFHTYHEPDSGSTLSFLEGRTRTASGDLLFKANPTILTWSESESQNCRISLQNCCKRHQWHSHSYKEHNTFLTVESSKHACMKVYACFQTCLHTNIAGQLKIRSCYLLVRSVEWQYKSDNSSYLSHARTDTKTVSNY